MSDFNDEPETIDRLSRVWSDRREQWLLLRVQATRVGTPTGATLYTLERVEEIR
ncbi:MAG: hypothetical protein R2762_09900 [Bryobacteraceae bacterium]